MSAFMVEDKTINRVVTWLGNEVKKSEGYDLKEKLEELNYNLTSDEWEEILAKDMFQLNTDGVNARYGNGEAEKFRPLDFQYQSEYSFTTVQILKSLQCWLYQCTEGNLPKTELYQFFDNVVETYLLKKIVYALPQYDSAEWA